MDSLVDKYRELADRGGNFYGTSIVRYREDIRVMVVNTKSQTLLDFGCGRGDAYQPPHAVHVNWHVPPPTLYDPAFEKHNVLPTGKFDGVLCSDVLEHIPEQEVDAFVARLFGYAERFVWASVCCRPAKKTFDDGVTNLHVTIQPYAWWRKRFDALAGGVPFELVEAP